MNKVNEPMVNVFVLALAVFFAAWSPAQADQTNIFGPAGSGQFGTTVTVLPNGNLVVTDPYYSTPSVTNAGAVYLYNGATLNLISTLTGNQDYDQIGLVGYEMMSHSKFGGVSVLANGNYVVSSVNWHGNRGALTWCSATNGATGVVSDANSLVGSTANDKVGYLLTVLSNGNYVVSCPLWDNGAVVDTGAVTWGNGASGTVGAVSAANSLVGSKDYDNVGGKVEMMMGEVLKNGVAALSNGNYVVCSPNWDNGTVVDAGAATWGSGTTGITGTLSALNSLVGSTASDQVGYLSWNTKGVTALANGNYVVQSRLWDNGGVFDAGAATWGNGTAGITGTISALNSLIGSTSYDIVGEQVTPLTNGNYVVCSINWDNGAVANVGAATWGNGTGGTVGTISALNSLIGSTAGDIVGNQVMELANGNYVVGSLYWDNGAIDAAGAATWGNGTVGATGVVSAANSLVGSTVYDYVGGSLAVLANGNYVVQSSNWDNGGAFDAGAATWGSGTAGVTGTISALNSLVGSKASDQVGNTLTALANGNYVVGSAYWDSGSLVDAGAATWGSGTTGVTGTISAVNSLVGTTANDFIGYNLTALANGSYVVRCDIWDNNAMANAGAVTWGSGTAGITGTISVANSLVGTKAGDSVGSYVTALANGNYVVGSPYWDNGAIDAAGAVTWGNGTSGATGVVSAANSLVGTTSGDNVGFYLTALPNGNYVVLNPNYDNGAIDVAGAVTLGDGASGTTTGPLTSDNSVLGDVSGGGGSTVFAFNKVRNYLLAGYPAGNRITLMGYVAPTPSVTITATAGLHGVVAPSGTVTVALGGNTNFLITADTYYHIASLLTNDVSVAAALNVGVYTSVWENVMENGTLTATFAPTLTTTGTPYFWLAQYGLMNFEVDASSDLDGDGLTASQEYLASTCPTNAYTAGNPFNDGMLVAAGADPLQNVSQFFAAITNHPALFGLYTTNSISDLSLGHPMINVVSNNARVWMSLQVSHDLSSNTWTNVGDVVEWTYPVTTNKAFFRFHGSTQP